MPERKLYPEDVYPEYYKRNSYEASHELIGILNNLGIPFITPQGIRFLSYRFGDGCSVSTPLSHKSVRLRAASEYYQRHKKAPSDSALRAAFLIFKSQASRSTRDVHFRIGADEGSIHLDPAWNCGRHIEITRDGWSLRRNLIDTVPSPTVAPQPAVDPLHDIDPIAELDKLRHLLRLENDRPAWLRVVVWLLAAFRPADDNQHPRDYPILQISGPAGSGKTSAARMLRALVDPSLAPINFTPTNEAAGGRIARDNHVVFIDGATRLARRPAEVLARLSTGLPASFHGEMQNVSRPIIITTNEPDAADRLSSRILPVELPELPDPLPNDELNRRFEEHRKSIVEGILLLLAVALRCLPGMPFPEKARFPEAVQWATAALLDVDQKELVCVTRAENKLQADLIKITTEGGGEWKGTATELVAALNLKLTARALSQKLAEIHPICVTKSRRKEERTIKLTLEADAKPENPAGPGKSGLIR